MALDDYAAVEILDDKFRIITAKPFARAFKVYKNKGKVVYEKLPRNRFFPLSELLKVPSI